MAYYYVELCGYLKILLYFATFEVTMILLKPVAQNCLRLQRTSGSLLGGASLLAVENNPGSNPVETRFSLLSLHYPTLTGLPG